jgi:hypothetical protein
VRRWLTLSAVAVLIAATAAVGAAGRSVLASAPAAAAVPAATRAAPSHPSRLPAPAAVARTGSGQVRAFAPTAVVLPDGSQAAVRPAGVDPDGTLQVPASPAVAGWWTGGARAGDPFGSVVIAAHVDSRVAGVGVFARLLTARPGQTTSVTDGLSTARYRVTRVFDVAKNRLVTGTDVITWSGPPRLVLVTCSGPFDAQSRHYADNHVVVAVPER